MKKGIQIKVTVIQQMGSWQRFDHDIAGADIQRTIENATELVPLDLRADLRKKLGAAYETPNGQWDKRLEFSHGSQTEHAWLDIKPVEIVE